MSHTQLFFGGAVLLVLIFGGFAVWNKTQPGAYDSFAQCLTDADATFYGAFWCPHCQEQKALFGRSKNKLPYVECSTPDGQNRTAECVDANITGYPTWEFADGERMSGALSLETLAEKTGCTLPE